MPEHLEARLVALSLHLQALSQLLLPLEGAVQAQLRIADDGREDVVEIVRDAAREGADGLHLLRLAQLPLELALLLLRAAAVGHLA